MVVRIKKKVVLEYYNESFSWDSRWKTAFFKLEKTEKGIGLRKKEGGLEDVILL